MRNVFAVLTLVIVLVSLAAFAGCSKDVNSGARETTRIGIRAGDWLTGDFAASRIPTSGYTYSSLDTPRSGSSENEGCFNDCSLKFDTCRDQQKLSLCRIEYNTCLGAC